MGALFGLPQATEVNKGLPKKAVFDRFKPITNDRKLFDEQISRLAIVAEISPHTVNVVANAEVAAIFIILATLKTADCDKKNIQLLSRLIEQRMLFALQYENTVRFAVFRAGRVLMSERKLLEEWQLNLRGLDLGAVWANMIADIVGIDLTGGKMLDEALAFRERRDKLIKEIAALNKKAMSERQPRRKWEYAEAIKRLQVELEELNHG